MAEFEINIHAPNGSGFDTWNILNNLTWERRVVDLINTGKGIISLKIFTGYISEKTIPQHLYYRCGITHLNLSLKKTR